MNEHRPPQDTAWPCLEPEPENGIHCVSASKPCGLRGPSGSFLKRSVSQILPELDQRIYKYDAGRQIEGIRVE